MVRYRVLLVLVAALLVPAAASAQSAIAGTVSDTSSAVLPGVTVEARSPALIEQVRSVVTDASGRYRITDLRPGVYSVTFSLGGFSTFVRDAIVLETQFTATVDAQLRVGTVEETITVTGQSPVVDVQNTVRREVISQEQIQTLPTGRSLQAMATMLPAVVNTGGGGADVGGSAQMQQGNIAAYGGLTADMTFEVDGMDIMTMFGSGSTPGFYQNVGAYEEMSYQVVAGTAESDTGGIRVNLIPRTGGNLFAGDTQFLYSNESLQGDNTTDEALRRGLTARPGLNELYDLNSNLGGPISRDKLWFFGSYRLWAYNPYVLNIFNPDGTPFVDASRNQVLTGRVTAQVSERNKITGVYDRNMRLRHYFVLSPGLTEPEGAPKQEYPNTFIAQAKWTSTLSNRLLFDAGFSVTRHLFTLDQQEGIDIDTVSKFDTLTTRLWNNSGFGSRLDDNRSYNIVSSLNYVTGSHAVKIGGAYKWGNALVTQEGSLDMQQQYRNGAPSTVLIRNTPFASRTQVVRDIGLYVQDSWRIGRLTLNPGLRWDALNGRIPEQVARAGRFVPARLFPAVDDMPNYSTFSPRFGAAYDLFGDGRTAVKGSMGRYLQQIGQNFAATYNPMISSTASVAWTDLNRDDIAQGLPGCVYLTPGCEINLAQVPISFGVRPNRNPDPDLPRPYQMLYNVALQHQLMEGLGVGIAYTRRDFYDTSYIVNLDVPHSAYNLVNVADPRGNGQTLPVYNLQPAFLGRVNQLDTKSNNTRNFNAVDLSINARFKNGASLFGGTSTGRDVGVTCEVADPNSLRFCDESGLIPWRTQFKLSGILPLPYEFRLSGVFQSVLGAEFVPIYRVDRTVLPTLTQTFVNVELNEPANEYYDRLNQLDFSVSKIISFRGIRVIPQVDLFNALNAGTILTANTTYGSSLGNVLTMLNARLIRFGVQMRF